MTDETPTDFTFHARHTHDTPDFTFELDEYRRAPNEQRLLAHIAVHQWTPSVLKKILHEWRTLRKCVTAPIFVTPKDDDEKWIKFVQLLGFRPLNKVMCNDGVERNIFIHIV
jgi:hypothetical protein